MAEQITFFSNDYDEFVKKFETKKTTDDCYTPPNIYAAILEWVVEEYGVNPRQVVRPFVPGGDFESYPYKDDAVVVDNPPFSLLAQIIDFYCTKEIKFFLFAPALTLFSGGKNVLKINHIVCDADIIYQNGARVNTGFVTNLSEGIVLQTAPKLGEKINEENRKNTERRQVPKYSYPDHVLTSAIMQRYSHWGIDMIIRAEDCIFIKALDFQRAVGKALYGGGLLLSNKAAAERAAAERAAVERAAVERAAAERAAAERWELSPRELEIIESLGGKQK